MVDGIGDRPAVTWSWARTCLRPSVEFRAGCAPGGGAAPVEVETLTPVGELAATRARQRVPDERAYDFELAVNEVATNAIERAGGGTLLLWEGLGAVVCEVFDNGPPSAWESRVREGPVEPSSLGDHELWFVGQLVDGFEVRAAPERICVRLWITVRPPADRAG